MLLYFFCLTRGIYQLSKALLTKICGKYIYCLQKLALILFTSAKDGGYANPTKVEKILGVSAPVTSARTEVVVSGLETSVPSAASVKRKSKTYTGKL